MKIYNFDWTDEAKYNIADANNRKNVGILAEELREQFPLLIDNLEGHTQLDGWQFIVLLLKAIQEITTKVEVLEGM